MWLPHEKTTGPSAKARLYFSWLKTFVFCQAAGGLFTADPSFSQSGVTDALLGGPPGPCQPRARLQQSNTTSRETSMNAVLLELPRWINDQTEWRKSRTVRSAHCTS